MVFHVSIYQATDKGGAILVVSSLLWKEDQHFAVSCCTQKWMNYGVEESSGPLFFKLLLDQVTTTSEANLNLLQFIIKTYNIKKSIALVKTLTKWYCDVQMNPQQTFDSQRQRRTAKRLNLWPSPNPAKYQYRYLQLFIWEHRETIDNNRNPEICESKLCAER